MRRRKEKYWEKASRQLVSDLELEDKFHLNGDLKISFDTAYFIMDASNLNVVWASKKSIDILNLPPVVLEGYTFLEYIVKNVHPTDIPKIETYLDLAQQEKDFTFSEILSLKHSDGCWRDIYMNIVVGTRYPNNFPEQLFGCIIDLTNQLSNRPKSKTESLDFKTKKELDLISSLSKREMEILNLIIRGFTDKEIGVELNISYYTADTHRKNIINKLKVKNTACLAYFAGKIGIF
ncbi:response regulator transcription factor [Ancylomarina euxinus]|nr:LuxR C-terminal-related transcriptional regulator [Ancylomarina euxinus]MCZ4694029.1 LuxR C-terminal-related transcriptional regulator [Ancylomarina euxinus]